ncbi:MAG: hypothetical protein BGO96_05720 [Micrococcales bacterium 73-15]|nr:MAG: hypothetical protein BGO96_05720 [Micrococcales bacterium 73-15]
MTPPMPDTRSTLDLPPGPAFMLDGDEELFVLPSDADHGELVGRGRCWFLPESPTSSEPAWLVEADGAIVARRTGTGWRVETDGPPTRTAHRPRPHADVTGAPFLLDLPGGELLADAFAGFYWGTMLPSVIERTAAKDYPDADGYVASTLASTYLGTYPDVDHEFQIKGRLAWGSRLDLDVVRRMIELQLRMMREDPTGLWRDPCAVQPDGTREYHVRRNSMDGRENAVMFLVTGNIEVLESIWLYVARTKDVAWLAARIHDVEGAASGIEEYIDAGGRLWGDVYYEDQVIKDGRETMAQALAVRSYGLLAELEDLLHRGDRAVAYRALRDRLAASLRDPLPSGWWDADELRFVDWVDRSGRVHDHIHLLANVLPVLAGAADAEQERAVEALVQRELAEFQRFPTFLSARIADYTDSEIGDGGPYDLCAAGRYWCWDAAYWWHRRDGRMLRDQLDRVAAQGAADGYVMGERYDMDHVYYVDGSPWHGAAHYYEYPCVYSWVLVHDYLGIRPALDVDLVIAPRLTEVGTVELGAFGVRYTHAADGFTLENLAGSPRTFRVDLSALHPGAPERVVEIAAGGAVVLDGAAS